MKQKGKAGLFFLSCYLLLFCCSSPLTSLFLFHVFCIVLSPIYPNIKTDASSRTNDRPMYSTWFFFGLYDLVFFKMHKLLLASGINCLHVYLFPRLPIYPIPGWKDGWWPSTPDWQPLQTPTRVKKRQKEWSDHQDAHHPHACITLITKTIITTNILITTAFSPALRPSLKDRKSDHWPQRGRKGALGIFSMLFRVVDYWRCIINTCNTWYQNVILRRHDRK